MSKDYSNYKPFNNIPCKAGEVLAPVVLDENMVEILKPMGLDKNNKVRWQFPGAGEKVPTVFIQVQAEQLDFCVKDYNAQAKKYLRRKWKETDDLSLDKFLDDAADDENESGFDPTGNTKDMEEFELKEMLQWLIGELMKEDPDMAEAIRLLAQEYTNGEVGQMVKPDLGSTQAYAFVKKAQKRAKEIYSRR